MCGIVGYLGGKDAVGVIVDGLKRLEYRGYDSAGLAVLGPAGLAKLNNSPKSSGRSTSASQAACPIGSTRWNI